MSGIAFGYFGDMFWICLGYVWDMFWILLGYVLDMLGIVFASFLIALMVAIYMKIVEELFWVNN